MPSLPPPQSDRRDGFFDHLGAAATVALAGGGAAGLVAGLLLGRLEFADLVLPTAGGQALATIALAALGAVVAAAALLPAALLVAAAGRLGLSRQPVRPARFYALLFAVGGTAALAYLYAAFNVVRDPKSALGLTVGAGIAAAAALALWALTRRSPRRAPARRRRARWPAFAGLALAGLLAAALPPRLGSRDRALPATAPDPAVSAAAPPSPSSGPPIVLVSIDTQRADHLGAYGYGRDTTPRLDALAADGVLFERAWAPSPWTLPSHASLMTGLDPGGHGARFTDNMRFFSSRITDRMAPWNLTLAELLAAAGYRTAGFTASRWLGPAFGFEQGFERLEANRDDHPAPRVVDKAISWLDRIGPQPFFLFLHFFDVHDYASPEAEFRRFHPEPYGGKARGSEWKTMGNLWQQLTPADLRYVVARYDGALRHVDAELGRLFDHLRALGRWEEAVIVVTADHGEEFLDHGATGHGQSLYDEQLRVPLLLKPPAAVYGDGPWRPGRRIGELVRHVDLAPTVAELAGLPPEALVAFPEGRSLLPPLAGRRRADPPPPAYAVRRPARKGMVEIPGGLLLAARGQRYKLLLEDGELSVFDLEADPLEQSPLDRPPPPARELARWLRDKHLAIAGGAPTAPDEELPPDLAEELRALGYVD